MDYYLAVDGIAGDTSSDHHYGLEVTDFSFADTASLVTRKQTTKGGQIIETMTVAGPPQLGAVSVHVATQQGLTDFLTALNGRSRLEKATLYGQTGDGDALHDAYALTLSDFLVTGVHEDGAAGYTVELTPSQVQVAIAKEGGVDTARTGPVLTQANGDGDGATVSPVHYYLTLGNGIAGDSATHPGAFELKDFSFDATATPTIVKQASANGVIKTIAVAGTPAYSSLLASFESDGALDTFYALLTSVRPQASRLTSVDIYGVSDGPAGEQIVSRIQLGNVLVSHVADDAGPGMSANLAYESLRLTSYDRTGAGAVVAGDTFTERGTVGIGGATGTVSATAIGDAHYYLAVEGIKGGTTAAQHEGLEVTGFSFADDASLVTLKQAGKGGTVTELLTPGAGAKPGEVTVAVATQQGLTDFLTALGQGTKLGGATLYGQTGTGADAHDISSLTLRDFLVTGVREDGTAGYTVTLAPQKFQVGTTAEAAANGLPSALKPGLDITTGGPVDLAPVTGAAGGATVTPTHYYMTLGGGITGDSISHPGAFELADFSFDALAAAIRTQSVTKSGVTVAGLTAGTADYSTLSASFETDGGLATFYSLLTSTQPRYSRLSSVTVYGVTDSANGEQIVSQLQLGNVLVGGVSDDPGAGFSASLGYETLKLTSYDQSRTGTISVGGTFAQSGIAGDRANPATISANADGDAQYYLAVDGIRGGTSAAQHDGLQVAGFSFSDDGNLVTVRQATKDGHVREILTPGAGGAKLGDVTVAIATQQGLTDFLTALTQGTKLATATLYGQDSSGPGAHDVYTLTLGNFFVTGVHEDGANGYTVTLTPQQLEVSTKAGDDRGSRSSVLENSFAIATVSPVDLTPATGKTGGATVAPTHYYLTIDADGYQSGFALDDFSFDATAAVVRHQVQTKSGMISTAYTAGTPDFGTLLASFATDGAFTTLFAALARGTLFTANLYGTTDTAQGEQVTYQAHLTNALVSSVADDTGEGFKAGLIYDRLTLTTYDETRTGAILVGSAFGASLAANAPPEASGVRAVLADTQEDKISKFPAAALLQGFTDANGDTLTLHSVTADHGKVAIDESGRYVITPDANYNGLMTLSYTVSDDYGGNTDATLGYTLTPVNDPPTLTGASAVLAAAKSTVARVIDKATLLQGWIDADGDTLTVGHFSADRGTVEDLGAQIRVTPDSPTFAGTLTLRYEVSDGTASVRASLGYALLAPTTLSAITTDGHVSVGHAETLIITGTSPSHLLSTLAVDFGDGSGPAQATVVYGGDGGFTASVDHAFASIRNHVVTATARDGDGTQFLLASTVAAVDDAPALTGTPAMLAASAEDVARVIDKSVLLTGWTDADGDTLSVTNLVADHGTVTNLGMQVRITPVADYNGPMRLAYSVDDGHGASRAASLSYAVTPVNDMPTAVADTGFTGTSGTPIHIARSALLANDRDVDGDTLSVVSVGNAEHGSVALVGDDVVFTPTAGYVGAASFTYDISDGALGASATASLTVTQTPASGIYLMAGAGDDVIDRHDSNDRWLVNGGAGNDTITGGSGNDSLNGGVGDDVLHGGGDNDVITGGAGRDMVWGDAGADNFLFNFGDVATGSQLDEIMDFEGAGNGYDGVGDILTFYGFGASATLTLNATRTAASADATAHYYDIDSATFHGTIIVHYAGNAVLRAGDFGFH